MKKKDFKVLITYPNLTMMLVPGLAIGIFTKILRDNFYQVELFDTTHYVSEENSSPQNRVKFLQARKFDETDDLGVRIKTDLISDYVKRVKKFKPDLILYSVVEDCYMQCLSLMGSIKHLDIPSIVGGVFTTASPEVCINNELINMIGLGEGENTIIEVSEAIRLNKSFKNIKGIWYKSKGKIIKNDRAPLTDINESIPDFSLFEKSRFNRPMGGKIFKTFPIETYRGCPFTCTYCNSPMHNTIMKEEGISKSFLRRKDIKLLRDEISSIINEYDPEFLYFVDDSFTARPKSEVFKFCEMYEEFKLPFWFNTRPETLDRNVLKRLKDVGAYRMSLGVESGNDQFRQNVLRRKGSNEQLRKFFKNVKDSNIPFSLNLIIGFPGETYDMVIDTVEFVRTLKGYDTVTVSIFTPYHGTVLRSVAVKNGWLEKDYITKHTTSSSALKMPTPYLSSEMIDGLMRVLPLYIYFPKSDWSEIRRAEIADEEGDLILEKYSNDYKKYFLKENQDETKSFVLEGGTGCKSNRKDSLSFFTNSQTRKDSLEIQMLTM